MRLDGAQFEAIQNALLSGFSRREELMMLARIALNQNLNEITGSNNLQDCTFYLIDWAEKCGQLDALLEGACRRNPGNPGIRSVYLEYEVWKAQAPATVASKSPEEQTRVFAQQIGVPVPELFRMQQYDLYQRVWISVQALKEQGDYLWQRASTDNLLKFSDQLRATTKVVADNSILFENLDYQELQNLLRRLGKYRVGKQHVIEIRSRRDLQFQPSSRATDAFVAHALERQIEENRALKQNYEEILETVRQAFHRTLSGGG